MTPVNRRLTYKLYPTAKQAAALEHHCDMLRRLYNAALEERIDAYRKAGKTMAASAKGSIDKPGKRVKQKAGLNRAILDATPGRFLSMLAYKAAEAGCELVMIDTRTHRPSQTCPGCGCVEKKPLQHREHRCGCGFVATRDQAAALHMLTVARQVLGREPAQAVKAA